MAEARARATQVLAIAERAVADSGASPTMGSRKDADTWMATARANQQRLDGKADPATWARVAALWSEIGDPYQQARALWREAEATLALLEGRTGRRSSIAPLQAAHRAATALGAGPLVREIEDLAERALVRLDPRAPLVSVSARPPHDPVDGVPGGIASVLVPYDGPSSTNAFGLSPRERDVLRLIVSGRTNREIGDRLFISQKTVGVHVGNILSKLAVSGRVEAATVAIRLGLVEIRRE